MARPLRIQLAGGVYHVTSRGDGREAIYLSDGDRDSWLEVFRQVCERFHWVCHAWCQMTNHYHILIETPEANLAQGMRQLNGLYTQRFNRAHGRVGHVFQGRYKAIFVERDNYLQELARYVAFVHAGARLPSVWTKLQGEIYLGSSAFVQKMQAQIEQRPALGEIPVAQRRPLTQPLAQFEAHYPRQEAMARAYLSGRHSMAAIALHFGVHYSTVSRAVKNHEEKKRNECVMRDSAAPSLPSVLGGLKGVIPGTQYDLIKEKGAGFIPYVLSWE
ncbi:MAG: transposase [Desulfobulbaceae bacterium]|nr:transposase [Desulfobulbaceae bacterium]